MPKASAPKEYRARVDSKRRVTLRGMDEAVRNLRAGKTSKPVDLKKLAAMKI